MRIACFDFIVFNCFTFLCLCLSLSFCSEYSGSNFYVSWKKEKFIVWAIVRRAKKNGQMIMFTQYNLPISQRIFRDFQLVYCRPSKRTVYQDTIRTGRHWTSRFQSIPIEMVSTDATNLKKKKNNKLNYFMPSWLCARCGTAHRAQNRYIMISWCIS